MRMKAELIQALTDDAQRLLSPRKFLHLLGVTHTAATLAARHGVPVEQAVVAGLLHDWSKSMPPAEIEADLRARGVEIPEEDRDYPAVWHGLHAAVRARQEGLLNGLEGSEAIEEAVALHSTADAGIGPLAKILFIADYTEPGRQFDGVEELRSISARDLELGFSACLERKCRHMVSKGQAISLRAMRAAEAAGIDLRAEEVSRAPAV